MCLSCKHSSVNFETKKNLAFNALVGIVSEKNTSVTENSESQNSNELKEKKGN